MALSGNDRMTLNAILERMLNSQGDTFNAQEAQQLIEATEEYKASFASVSLGKIGGSEKSHKTEGYAEGIGNVQIEDEQSKSSIKTNLNYAALNKYRLYHRNSGALFIEHMWLETYEDETGKSWMLSYDSETKEPLRLSILSQMKSVKIPMPFLSRIEIPYKAIYTLWKKPE